MNEQTQQNTIATSSNNLGYNSASALSLRLNCEKLLTDIEDDLKGQRTVMRLKEDTETYYEQVESVGEPLANEEGIRKIMSYFKTTINPQVVQGNFPSDGQGTSKMFDDFIEDFLITLLDDVVANCWNWEIKEENIDSIINIARNMVIPFMTRLIDNKERESYEHTLTHKENNTVSNNEKGRFNFLGGG